MALIEVIWINNKQEGRNKEVKDKTLTDGVLPSGTLITRTQINEAGDFKLVLYEDGDK